MKLIFPSLQSAAALFVVLTACDEGQPSADQTELESAAEIDEMLEFGAPSDADAARPPLEFGPAYKAHEHFCVNGEECRTGDVNGDGRDDLIAFIKDTAPEPVRGDVWVALSNGVTFDAAYKAYDYFCIGEEECHVGDYDGDGRDDVLLFVKDSRPGEGRGDVWVARSNGSTFDAHYRAHDYFCVGAEVCEVADFNGDRKEDLITFIKDTAPEPGRGDVWLAQSNGNTFGPAYHGHHHFCVGSEECHVGDITGDGKADLVAFIKESAPEPARNDVWAARSNGNTFEAAYPAHDYFCVGAEECDVADVNGDGRHDIVTFIKNTKPDPLDPENHDVWAALSDGNDFGAGFALHDYFCVGNETCATADINRDGLEDLVSFIGNVPGIGFGDVWVARGRALDWPG